MPTPVYEFTLFSKQKRKADIKTRPSINKVISDMKRGHFSNAKVVKNASNVFKAAGVPAGVRQRGPTLREVRVTDSLRIFFYEEESRAKKNTLFLVCMGHMEGNDVKLNP